MRGNAKGPGEYPGARFRARATAADLQKPTGNACVGSKCDVISLEDITATVDRAVHEFAGVSTLGGYRGKRLFICPDSSFFGLKKRLSRPVPVRHRLRGLVPDNVQALWSRRFKFYDFRGQGFFKPLMR